MDISTQRWCETATVREELYSCCNPSVMYASVEGHTAVDCSTYKSMKSVAKDLFFMVRNLSTRDCSVISCNAQCTETKSSTHGPTHTTHAHTDSNV